MIFNKVVRTPVCNGIQRGDHVRVARGLYWHHAVAIDGEWLVEFGSGIWGGVARYVHRSDFSRGSTIAVVPHPVRFSPDESVCRAISQLGRNDFDLLTRNCEHFANWCVTGKWESWQIQSFTALAAVAVLLLAGSKAGKWAMPVLAR